MATSGHRAPLGRPSSQHPALYSGAAETLWGTVAHPLLKGAGAPTISVGSWLTGGLLLLPDFISPSYISTDVELLQSVRRTEECAGGRGGVGI